MFCEKCNKNYPETAFFCPQCGSRLTEVLTESETAVEEEEKNDIIIEESEEEKEDFAVNDIAEDDFKEEEKQSSFGMKIDLNRSEGSYTAPKEAEYDDNYFSDDTEESFAEPSEELYVNPEEETVSEISENEEVNERKVSKFSAYFNDKKNSKRVFLLLIGAVLIIAGIIAVPNIYKSSSYNKAVSLFESGAYYSAADKFKPLAKKDYKHSSDYLNYIYAVESFETGDYESAEDYFDEVNPYIIGVSKEYNNYIDYIEAKEAYDDGEYYTAYNLFNRISGFEDAGEMAEKCVKGRLVSKVISVKSEYKGSSKLEIKIPKGAYDAYVKVYDTSDNEVACLYVRDGESAGFDIKSGNYIVKANRGDKWFGAEEMFGGDLINVTINGKDTLNVGNNEIVTVTLN